MFETLREARKKLAANPTSEFLNQWLVAEVDKLLARYNWQQDPTWLRAKAQEYYRESISEYAQGRHSKSHELLALVSGCEAQAALIEFRQAKARQERLAELEARRKALAGGLTLTDPLSGALTLK